MVVNIANSWEKLYSIRKKSGFCYFTFYIQFCCLYSGVFSPPNYLGKMKPAGAQDLFDLWVFFLRKIGFESFPANSIAAFLLSPCTSGILSGLSHGISCIAEVQMEMCHLNIRVVHVNVMQDVGGLTRR